MQTYEVTIGDLPTTKQGLQALRAAPKGLTNPSKWEGPYLAEEIPMDPWGNPYQYAIPGVHNPKSFERVVVRTRRCQRHRG